MKPNADVKAVVQATYGAAATRVAQGAANACCGAAPASVAKMKELCDAYEMQFIIGQVTGYEAVSYTHLTLPTNREV